MKNWILGIFLLFVTNIFGFNYSQYAKTYIDKVNNTKIKNGICIELIEDMLLPIEDSLLIDINKMVWGSPITDLYETVSGDIIIYDNHIIVVYDNKGDSILVADQNKDGDSSGVNIYMLDRNKQFIKNFQIFRPINLQSINLYNKGYSKSFCLKLYTINIRDEEKLKRSVYNIKYDNTLKPYILDPNLEYTEAEFYYAKYFNGKVLCNNGCYIRIPSGRIIVGQMGDGYIKPLSIEK